MRIFSLFTLFLFIACFSNAHAALNGLSHHSRANCGNNESISWDATMLRNLAAASEHFVWINFSGFLSSPTAHFVETGARFNVYRAGAVHYHVYGFLVLPLSCQT